MPFTFTAGSVVSFNSRKGNDGISLSPPAGIAEGDLMLAFQMRDFDDGSFTVPSGWNEVMQKKRSGGEPYQIAIMSKYAGASEGATTFLHSDTFADQWAGLIVRVEGTH